MTEAGPKITDVAVVEKKRFKPNTVHFALMAAFALLVISGALAYVYSLVVYKNIQLESKLLEIVQKQSYLVRKNEAAKLDNLQKYISARYTKIPDEFTVIIAKNTYDLCVEHNISLPLIVGLMEVESAFNPLAVSKKDARGLLQVTYSVWYKQLKIKSRRSLHDVRTGIDMGIRVLRHYIEKEKGNVSKALSRYNGTKKEDFSNRVYRAAGRFTVFCDRIRLQNEEANEKVHNEKRDSTEKG